MTSPLKQSVGQVVKNRFYALTIIFWILVVHLVAIAQFTSGFLLTRPVLDAQNDVVSLPSSPFERAVVLVVDALRYDFVETPANAPDAPYLRHFPLSKISNNPKQSFSVKFLADPPTTTLQRLKGLTTGSLPAFVDAGSNFAGFQIEEDNWVSQAAHRLGSVAFVGDDTWEALFSHELEEVHSFPSLNVRDLDTVDQGVKSWLGPMISNSSNKVVIGHMLGVDHVGHRYGPAHPAMSAKLDETFAFVEEVAQLIDDKTVLLVMGDHGMDSTGNHGGDSVDELEAGLWMYSKRGAFTGEGPTTVNQIDLVPTLSGLLGLPIPYNSLGFPIRQAFGSASDWAKVVTRNDEHLKEYAATIGMDQTEALRLSKGDALIFQEQMLAKFKEAWAQFDVPAMKWGIGTLLGSLVMSLLFYSSISLPLLQLVARGQTIGAISGTILGAVTQLEKLQISPFRYGVAVSQYTGVGIIALGILPVLRSPKFSLPSRWSVLALFILAAESATSFSNSFVIWESKAMQFFIASCVVALVVASTQGGSPLVTYLGLWYALAVLLLTRLASSWVLCREETASRCASTFFDPGSSLVPTWTLFLLGTVALIMPFMVVRFWAIGQNNVGIANLLLNITPLAIALTTCYWSLDNAEARGWLSHDTWGLQNIKLLLGRLTLVLGVGCGLVVWWRSSLPIQVVLSKHGAPEKIAGYNNIFGSYGLLAVVCVFWSLLITNKPPAGLSMIALLYTALACLDLLDVTSTKYTLLAPVLFDLLANGFFYYTGHQATIPSIQWDAAFIAARTVSFPWSPITVVLNTFGPFILCAMMCIFSALWRRTPFKDPVQPLVFLLRAAAGFTLVTGVRTATSVISAYTLRRHLMTWKIFAPRFMFGGMVLILCDLACLIGIVFSAHTVKKVAEIFG